MKRIAKTESGFTLLELLISLVMLAVLVTACFMTVRLAIASREAGNQKTDHQQRLRVLHERLNSSLRSAHLIFVPADSLSLISDENEKESSQVKILAFEGHQESLKFVTFNDKLMGGDSNPWMHEVHFYLQKNEDTGSLEILLNERNFFPENFFDKDSLKQETSQTLRIAQDVAYLKFRYYIEILEKGISSSLSDQNPVKVSGEWADKIITEPIDFKSSIVDNEDTGTDEDMIRLPRAVEFSVGLWKSGRSAESQNSQIVELPPMLIPIQSGMVFKRFLEEGE